MRTEQREFTRRVDTLVSGIRELLDSSIARDRVEAVRLLAAGVSMLEREVLLDAQASGMSWGEIGRVYGVSRQAAHRRFSDDTVVPADYFDDLLRQLDADETEVVPTLRRAARRAHGSGGSS